MGELLISLQNNTLSRAELSDELGVAKNVHYGDVLIKFGNVLDVSKERFPMISDEGVLEKYKESFLKNGDVIVADTAEDSTVGKCSEISGLNDEVVLSGLHTIPYRPIEKFAFGYLGYYLNSNAYHDQLIPLMQGIKVTSISKSAMKDTEIVYPKSVEEQGKVAEYFRNLDRLITLHQQKLTLLTKLKKAMLEKMFPKKGSVIPEIRFNGFANAWEQRKLGAITDSFSGGTPTAGKAEYYGGEIPFIRSGEISSDSTELFITDAGLNNSSAKMVGIGDILYALYGATSGETSISRINGAINQAILAIRPTKGDDPYMIVQWLKKQKETIISTYLQGGQGNLSGSIVKDLLITLPKNKDEQAKVGSFFKQLDHLITLHQRKIDKLKNLKKAMLDQMFI